MEKLIHLHIKSAEQRTLFSAESKTFGCSHIPSNWILTWMKVHIYNIKRVTNTVTQNVKQRKNCVFVPGMLQKYYFHQV